MLTHHEIYERLDELCFQTDNPNYPFVEHWQIKSCTVDLRLSNVIFVPRKFKSIDLKDKIHMGEDIANAFKRQEIDIETGFCLKPSQFILGRTYEEFKIPDDLSGQLVGRSSLARLGLSISLDSGFINPGWSGNMPLMIVNNSPFKITIYPYLGIAQLELHKLDSIPKNTYGSRDLESKYINDDGGPSKYYLDQTVQSIAENLNFNKIEDKNQIIIDNFTKNIDENTRSRLNKFIKKTTLITSALSFLNLFIKKEKRRGYYLKVFPFLSTSPIFFVLSQGYEFLNKHLYYSIFGVVFYAAIIAWLIFANYNPPMTEKELKKALDEALSK